MTDRQIKRMSKGEMLEILVAQSMEIDRLMKEVGELRAELDNEDLRLENTGSLMGTSLKLDEILWKAQQEANRWMKSCETLCAKGKAAGEMAVPA